MINRRSILVLLLIAILLSVGCSQDTTNEPIKESNEEKTINTEESKGEKLEKNDENETTKKNDKLKPIQVDEHWGYENNNGDIIISPEFDAVKEFSEGLAAVKMRGRWVFIDTKGKVVINHRFDDVTSFDNGISKVKVYDHNGKINKDGEFIVDKNSDVIPKKVGLWGYVTKQDQEIAIYPEYHEAYDFSEGVALVKQMKKSESGNSDIRYFYINRQGQRVFDSYYDNGKPFTNGIAPVQKNGHWGVIDKQGDLIIEFQYDTIEHFSKNLMKIQADKKWGLINYKGDVIVEPKYDTLEATQGDFSIVESDNQWGFIDSKGTIVIEPTYDFVFPFKVGRAKVYKDNTKGYINKKGEIEEQFREFDSLEEYNALTFNTINERINLIDALIESSDPSTADQMVLDLIDILENKKVPELRSKYQFKRGTPDFSDIYIKNNGWFEPGASYSFVIDYEAINANYWEFTTKAFRRYFDLMKRSVDEPVGVDDGMSISFDELVNRVIEYELYLRNYSDFELSDEIKALYKSRLRLILDARRVSGDLFFGERAPEEIYEELLTSGKDIPLTKEIITELSSNFQYPTEKSKQLTEFIEQSMVKIEDYRFNSQEQLNEKLLPVEEENLWGYIDEEGQTIIEPQYDYVLSFKDNEAQVIKNNKVAVIDRQNNIIEEFKSIENFDAYDELTIENIEEMKTVIDIFIPVVEPQLADQMINDLISFADQQKFQLSSYSRQYSQDHNNSMILDRVIGNAISEAKKQYPELFNNGFGYFNKEKFLTLHYINSDQVSEKMENLFNNYLGVYFSEGDMSATVDYLHIHEKYGQYLTDEFSQYLEIKGENEDQPFYAETSPRLTPEEVGERLISYENFMKTSENIKLKQEIKRLYMHGIRPLIFHNKGTTYLNEYYQATFDYRMALDHLWKQEKAEVTSIAARDMLDFIYSKEDFVVRTYTESNDMRENYELIDTKVSKLLDEKYFNESTDE